MSKFDTLNIWAHMRRTLFLGLPLVGGHLAQFAISLTDTIMLGWYGVEELAALTLAQGYFFIFFLVGSGFAWAVMPLVASFAADDDQIMIRRATRMGLWLSIMFFVFSLPFWAASGTLLQILGQTPALSAMAAEYLQIVGLGLLPALAVMTLKSYMAGLERTQVILWITVGAAVVNAIANYALVFGNFGAPEMGIVGAAVASVCTQVVSLIAAVVYVRAVLPEHDLFGRFFRPDTEVLARVFKLGWPISVTNLSEVGLFVVASIMMGWLGTIPLAAHGIAVQLATATFMVHVGLSNAATVRTGQFFGQSDSANLITGARAILILSVMVSLVGMGIFLFLPELLISAFLDPADPDRAEILAAGVGLLAVAAVFQLVDGGQVVLHGLLRGMQDTHEPMIISGIAYWGVGLPVSYGLGFWLDWGGVGIWLGLVAGLTAAAVLLNRRFWRHSLSALK